MKKLIIWGAGGHAREVNLLCEQLGFRVLGFLDERPEMNGVVVDDLPVLGNITDLNSSLSRLGATPEEVEIVCAGVGNPSLKKRFVAMTVQARYKIAGPLIHPNVHMSPRNKLGRGVIVCDGVTLTINVSLGEFVIVNRATTIGHDVVVEDYATISPGVNISGNVNIGKGCFIGTGASIREKTKVGAWSVVGGGAFVASDVPDHVLYAGVPAIFKKHLTSG